jgi:glycosidase
LTFSEENDKIFTKVLKKYEKEREGESAVRVKWKKIVSLLLVVVMTVLSFGDYTGISKVYAAENNSVTIHFKSEWDGANIFYWNQNGGYNNPVRWPGMEMKSEGEEWYTYTFENTKTVDFMFNYERNQTTHYTKMTGEYWLVNGKWYNHKPAEVEITPTSTPKPTATPKPQATQKPTQIATATPEPTKALEPTKAVAPTQAPQVTIAESDKSIKVHYRGEQQDVKLFYWNVNYGTNTPVAWPGTAMIFKGNNWFEYTIPNAEAANLIFVTEAGETEELYVLDGEWWYVDGEIMDYNPYGDEPIITTAPITMIPVPTVTIAPVVTEVPIITEKPVLPTKPAATVIPTVEPTATPEPTVTTAPTATPKPVVKGKMILHLNTGWSNPTIYYWKVNGAGEAVYSWPGTAMKAEANGWYTYTIENATSASLIFSDNGNSQTEDLNQKEGEWWYKDNKWYDYDPSGPTPTPGPTNTPRPTSTPKPTRDPNLPTPTPGGGAERGEDWDFRDETIYFVMTARFYDGDSSNNFHSDHDAEVGNGDDDPAWRGDFKGLIEKLDYIKALGFTAIWITPVVENASGYDFHGYHAINLRKVDPRLESDDATYQDLIDACHQKGIKVIQDIVLNHTGNSGEEGLFPMIDKTYTLGQGVSGNSYTATPKESAISSLNSYMSIVSNGTFSNYNDALSDTKNGPAWQYQSRDQWMKSDDLIYRKKVDIGWEDFTVTTGQFAGDCMELNTELPTVYNYLTDTYNSYIDMGVDAFRIDTVKHISRLNMNTVFIPSFKEAAAANGNDKFYMFGEVACRVSETWNHGRAQVSPPYYTWKSSKTYEWNHNSVDGKDNLAQCEQEYKDNDGTDKQPTSDNVFLQGNEYHTPDYSQSSGMGVIDYSMHFNFQTASKAFTAAKNEDKYMNDSSYNVVYVDSHDYGPSIDGRNDQDGSDLWRYDGGTDAWAENLCLMFTFRGIPCLYYGSEVEFMKGARIDNYHKALKDTGRAYYGDYLEGTVTATDFSEYTASGEVEKTLDMPLAKHLQRLNQIRAAIPALRKGQYSTENVSGNMAYKRRYTSDTVDSFVCVTVTDGATFNDIPNGTYTDAVTGDVQVVNNGTLTISAPGKGNMRVYVLDTELTQAPGKIGEDGTYLK